MAASHASHASTGSSRFPAAAQHYDQRDAQEQRQDGREAESLHASTPFPRRCLEGVDPQDAGYTTVCEAPVTDDLIALAQNGRERALRVRRAGTVHCVPDELATEGVEDPELVGETS